MDPDRRDHRRNLPRPSVERRGAARRRARWDWWYVIDGKHNGHCATHAKLPDPEAAMRRAIQAARLRADELG